MAMLVGGARGVRAEINVTPLVDVVLVLLIIFMVVTPLLVREMSVAIPPKAEIEPPPELAAQQVVLRYTRDRRLALNDQEIELAQLEGRLRDLYAHRREKVIFLDVEDAANYGEAVRIMDICRTAGVVTLGVVTRSP